MLKGKKTFIVAIGTVLGAIGAYLTGDADLSTTINLVVMAVLGATLRDGINTTSKNCAPFAIALAGLFVLSACSVTPQQIADVRASDRPVSAGVTLIGEQRLCSAGLVIFQALAQVSQTSERFAGLKQACAVVDDLALVAGPVIPVTATTGGTDLARACAALPVGHYNANAAAYAEARALAGCVS